jgi:hypothetical protein
MIDENMIKIDGKFSQTIVQDQSYNINLSINELIYSSIHNT